MASTLAEHNWEVHVYCPSMSKRQAKFIGVSRNISWKLHQSSSFKMTYDRYSYFGNKIQWIYRVMISKKLQLVAKWGKFSTRLSSMGVIPQFAVDEHTKWIASALQDINKIVSQFPINVVFSSSSPFSAHLIAAEVSTLHGIPWVADYRDLWSLNHAKQLGVESKEAQFEKNLLVHASATITATAGLSAELGQIYAGPIYVIHNFFHTLSKTWKTSFSLPLNVTYTGSIYEGFQDYPGFLEILDQINQYETKIELTVVGPSIHFIKKYYRSQDRKLPSFMHLFNAVDREKSYSFQRDADLLLLLNWNDPSQKGIESTKLFEYLGSGVPILSFGGTNGDAVTKILQETSTGFSAHDKVHALTYLREILENCKQGYSRKEINVLKYSQNNQSKILLQIFQDRGID